MKTSIITLVSFLVLSATSAFAQFTSSPAEPGLSDHLKAHSGSTSQLVNEKKMYVSGVSAEWISQDQITLSADVIDLKGLTTESRARIEKQMTEYNVSAAVGTLSMSDATVRMIHYVNPRLVSPADIERTVEKFRAAVDEQHNKFDKSFAAR